MKSFVLIDGSNFYYKLQDLHISDKKFSFDKFSNWITSGTLEKCKYYVGAIRQTPDSEKSQELYAKQRSFISSLEKEELDVQLGYILKSGDIFHEKGVDVKIAVDLLVGAYENLYDKAFLISSDTDLIPAVKKAVSLGKEIEYVGFSHSPSYGLLKACTSSRLLNRKDIETFVSD